MDPPTSEVIGAKLTTEGGSGFVPKDHHRPLLKRSPWVHTALPFRERIHWTQRVFSDRPAIWYDLVLPPCPDEAHYHGGGLAAVRVLLRACATAADGEPATDEDPVHAASETAVVRQPGQSANGRDLVDRYTLTRTVNSPEFLHRRNEQHR